MANNLSTVNTVSKFGTINNGEILRTKYVHTKDKYRVTFIGFGVNGESKYLTAEMTKFDPPTATFDSHKLDYVNGQVKFAGRVTWDNITFTLFDTYDNSVFQALQNQLQRQKDMFEQTTADAPSTYKFRCVFERTSGHQATVRSWLLEGCFLISVKEDSTDNGSGDFSSINVTMSFDNATSYDRDGNMIPTTSSEVVKDPQDAYAY